MQKEYKIDQTAKEAVEQLDKNRRGFFFFIPDYYS